jgi:nicotinamide-nucleotide amidase
MSSKNVLELLTKKGLTIAFAESMTGGLLSYEFVKNQGASKAFIGSIIAYSIDQKVNLLHLDEELIEKYGIVSPEVSVMMAKSIKDITQSNIAISITGNAGPDLQKNSIEKEAIITIIINNQIETFIIEFTNLEREESIIQTVKVIYEKLYDLLKKL